MDYLTIKTTANKFRSKLNDLRLEISNAERYNTELDRLLERQLKVEKARNSLKTIRHVIDILIESTQTEDKEFKNRRLSFLSEVLTNTLGEFFPEEEFTVKVVCDFNRGVKPELLLYDSSGGTRLLHVSEGKLLQTQISYASAIALLESLTANKIYLDEAFSVSSPSNLERIGEATSKAIERGFQFIMVAQHDQVYKKLPRREIKMVKDFSSKLGKAVITEVIDY